MFIGHFGVALGAKKLSPQLNLGLLFLACQLLDAIWPILVLIGIEKVSVEPHATLVTPLNFEYYPFSHSLVMTLLYSIVFGGLIGAIYKSTKVGLVTAFVVSSHWFLDFLTHRPDLPILLDGELVGLGLWYHPLLTVIVESTIYSLGIFLYLKAKGRQTQKQKIGFWSLVILLSILYIINLFFLKLALDTPPSMIAGPALSLWLIIWWAYMVDRPVH